ncbi:hypothetical protein KC19_VG164900 [Ceratodon purpureus]|uniref:Uncharacterized protein n=1 Tax=Ceratodon purpureus TaxID=3225 RepID=A0A8T0HRT6_CERPU|nr:hypothetical protein KC19_VG164900 [Ceratodon purpureus]
MEWGNDGSAGAQGVGRGLAARGSPHTALGKTAEAGAPGGSSRKARPQSGKSIRDCTRRRSTKEARRWLRQKAWRWARHWKGERTSSTKSTTFSTTMSST